MCECVCTDVPACTHMHTHSDTLSHLTDTHTNANTHACVHKQTHSNPVGEEEEEEANPLQGGAAEQLPQRVLQNGEGGSPKVRLPSHLCYDTVRQCEILCERAMTL
jgi:hypothetical protein